jgi:hypothetical protein
MITFGIFAHGQALVNPYIYGYRWRKSALKLGEGLPTKALKPVGKPGMKQVVPTTKGASEVGVGATPTTGAAVTQSA